MFSFQMTMLICISSINYTCGLFELYNLIVEGTKSKDFAHIFYSVGASYANTCLSMMVYIIVGISSVLMSSGQKAVAMLPERFFGGVENVEGKFLRRIQIFHLQLQHACVNISCGFFKLDWKVLMMVS